MARLSLIYVTSRSPRVNTPFESDRAIVSGIGSSKAMCTTPWKYVASLRAIGSPMPLTVFIGRIIIGLLFSATAIMLFRLIIITPVTRAVCRTPGFSIAICLPTKDPTVCGI